MRRGRWRSADAPDWEERPLAALSPSRIVCVVPSQGKNNYCPAGWPLFNGKLSRPSFFLDGNWFIASMETWAQTVFPKTTKNVSILPRFSWTWQTGIEPIDPVPARTGSVFQKPLKTFRFRRSSWNTQGRKPWTTVITNGGVSHQSRQNQIGQSKGMICGNRHNQVN